MSDHTNNANSEAEKKALDEVEAALRKYLEARGDIGDGVVLTNWGFVTAATRLIDGEIAYSTSSYQQPGGIPTYTWIGILKCEFQKWVHYFTAPDEEDDDD